MNKFEVADSLARDLAEKCMQDEAADMMMVGTADIARGIREKSESNEDQTDHLVQRYRGYRRVIYSSLYDLIEGYNGYKLVKVEEEL